MKETIRKDNRKRKLKDGESQRPDGRYMFRITNENGERKTFYSNRLLPTDPTPPGKKYQKSLREQEEDYFESLTHPAADQYTLSDFIAHYLQTKPNLSVSTKMNYETFLEKKIKPSKLGQLHLSDISKTDILDFYTDLHKTCCNGTIRLYQNILYPCFQLAVEDQLISSNPCINCMTRYPIDYTKKEALDEDQQMKLLSYVKDHPVYSRHYPLLVFMFYTCLRVGETIGFTLEDIHDSKGILDINHQFLYKKKSVQGTTEWFAKSPKWNSFRQIPINDPIERAIWQQKKWIQDNNCSCQKSIDGYKNILFPSMRRGPIQPNTINRYLENIIQWHNLEEPDLAKKEGREPLMLPHISAHTTRHTGCTRYAEAGMEPMVLKTLMGHKNIAVTLDVYTSVKEKHYLAEMARIMTNQASV